MKNENEEVKTVTAMIFNVPVGTVMPFMGNFDKLAGLTASGWHYCNGDQLNKDQYPLLFDMIGYSCGGSGVNFHLPDMRGVFVRGVDGTRGQDPDKADRTRQGSADKVGDVAGSYQGDQFKEHFHTTKAWINENKQIDDPGTGIRPANVEKALQSDSKGGSETRPKNISAHYIIFAGLPQ
ncbi:tail fiber protein [Mucilaginibacter sp. ZT4R22]|uniref:Tail fiber protein n=1 Tax=Mucilaginibacter pankratovii TaxID=2772110 RepID=A0ABR7WJ18_9SPHI|nr:phage tail protein [Mucilaginibacter pankratovii]MBD1362318.1 tail fiber protein [Mucilaginibacter pankratovii]